MARYDYRCEDCDEVTEVTCGMSEVQPRATCGQCGGSAVRLFHTPAAIHFRGPGFYSTDVTGRLHRKRRANPGDDLHKEFDVDAARIARSI